MWRREAVERYILLRLRVEDIKRLGYLVENCQNKTLRLSKDAPFALGDLRATARTALFGSLAGLADRNGRAAHIFDPLLSLFPSKTARIVNMESMCERCHQVLRKLADNRGSTHGQIEAHRALGDQDTLAEIESARKDFILLMDELVSQELKAIPELPKVLEENGLSRHPTFANCFRLSGAKFAQKRASQNAKR